MTVCSIPVLFKSYVFDPRPRFPFRIAMKRYWIGECPDTINRGVASKTPDDALTLVFMHAHGAHKEQWEPTIQRLFYNQQAAVRSTVRFHDMWSLDMLNHGDSAVLNEEVLQRGCDISSCEHPARAVHALLAGLGTGVDVDFSKRTLVLVGHSLGSLVGILATTYYPLLKISSLHLIEPFLSAENVQHLFLALSETSNERKDIWSSAEEAFKSLRVQSTMCTWDERIVKIFIEHGLRPLPTAEYSDLKEGVTLKCTRRQEAAAYRDYVTPATGYRYLPHLLKEIPTHIMFGAVADYISDELQHDILHVASGGVSNFASVTRIPDAGHMSLQTHPDALGDAIWKCLIQHENFLKDTMVAKL